MRTWDVVQHLLSVVPSARYAELLTPTTSPEHSEHVAALDFDRAEFLAYRSPAYEPFGPRPDLPCIERIHSLLPGEVDVDYEIGVIGPVADLSVHSVVVNTMSSPAAQWQWMIQHSNDSWLVAGEVWHPTALLD